MAGIEPRCEDCPFNGGQKVYGSWRDPQAQLGRVAMVGMAPAEEELAKGEVFVGISGQILRKVASKLEYINYYLCNILLCQIPDKATDVDKALAIDCCKERVIEEIRTISPKLIIALGAMPMGVFVGDYSIIKVAGRVFPTSETLTKIAPTLSTIHPAFVWRNPDFFYDFVEQMESGIKWLKGTYQSAVEPKMVIVTMENIEGVLSSIEEAGKGAIDVETTGSGFYPYGWESPDKIRCIVMAVDNKTAYIFPGYNCNKENPYWDSWPEGETEYENLLLNPKAYSRLKEVIEKMVWSFHHGQFDCGFFFQVGIYPIIHFDSMAAHYTLDEREYVHSLKRIAHKYLGAPDWEDDIKQFLPKKKDTYDKVPNSRLFWYASHDGTYTNQISERLEEETKDDQVLHKLLLPAENMFNELRHRGLRIDPKELMGLDEKLEVEVSKAEDELNVLCGEPINPGSPQEVCELLYDKLKFPIHPRYGRTSNKKALASYLPHPTVEKIIECRHLNKLKNTYVESLARFVDQNLRIHPFTWLTHSVTGRLATEDPSVMNIAKRGGIMKVYLPDSGHKFAALDFKGMELRWIAIETEDEHLKEILLDPDRDVHFEVAVEAFGEEGIINKVDSQGRVIGKTHKRRNPAKTIVFGRPYGRGHESIMYAERLTWEDTQRVVEVVDNFFPNLSQYQKRVRDTLHTKGYLVSYFGRYRRFGLLTRESIREYERQAYNFYIQSPASDLNLLCMLHLYKMREELKATPLWPIHDSIMFDIESEEVIPRLKREMENYAEEVVGGKMKFPVEVKVGDNWGDAIIWKEPGE